jgi:hypothetical protein
LLARLELAAGQHPRRSAVIGAAADKQDAAELDDDRDSDGLAVRLVRDRGSVRVSRVVGWPVRCRRVAGRIIYREKYLSRGKVLLSLW